MSMELYELEDRLRVTGQTSGLTAAVVAAAASPQATITFETGQEFSLAFFETAPTDESSEPGSVESDLQQETETSSVINAGNSANSSSAAASAAVVAAAAAVAAASKQDQQFAAADSNSSTPTKSFVPCKVCGDKASGYHYGVTSCEGCKGFFRRSIQKQIEYRCLRDGKCLVIRLNRNRCQYCRFKKCLAVGMSRDSVRYGRVPKRSRERSSGEERVSTSDNSSSAATPPDPETALSPVYDLIVSVSQAHIANSDYSEENTRALVRKPLPSPPSPVCAGPEVASSTAESLEQQRIWLWQQFATHVTPSVQRVVEFAKRVPGFCELSQDDQLILIKVGFFELWLSHASRLTTDTTLTFSDGTFVTRQQMELMYSSEFVQSMFEFTAGFNSLLLGDMELGLFSAVVLLSPDRPGVTDVKAVEQHQDRLVEALKLQMSRSTIGGDSPSVLAKLPELRVVGAKHALILDWFRLNWDKLRLPPLFAEIFDIPKCEEDLQ